MIKREKIPIRIGTSREETMELKEFNGMIVETGTQKTLKRNRTLENEGTEEDWQKGEHQSKKLKAEVYTPQKLSEKLNTDNSSIAVAGITGV